MFEKRHNISSQSYIQISKHRALDPSFMAATKGLLGGGQGMSGEGRAADTHWFPTAPLVAGLGGRVRPVILDGGLCS